MQQDEKRAIKKPLLGGSLFRRISEYLTIGMINRQLAHRQVFLNLGGLLGIL
jgi:hypothetical protein